METVFYVTETLNINVMTNEKKEDIQFYIDNCTKEQLAKMVSDSHEQIIKLQQQVKNCSIPVVSDSLPVACTMEDDKGELYWTRLSIKCAGEVITNLSKKVKAFENFIDSFNENYR